VVLRQALAVEPDPDADDDAPRPRADAVRTTVDVDKPYAEERRRALDAFELAYVDGVLKAHGSNVSRAARAAGLGRVYFYELLRRHRLR
jgi:DNA-binding NtrC family response regulator